MSRPYLLRADAPRKLLDQPRPRSPIPACEPCRRAKLACDHARPVCSRCKDQQKHSSCTYRVAPFKRKQAALSSQTAEDPSPQRCESQHSPSQASQTPAPSRVHVYPNPGHLGFSSHVAIFNQIFPGQDEESTLTAGYNTSPASTDPKALSLDGNPLAKQGAEMLKQLIEAYSLGAMEGLVSLWIKKGVNLALAEPFVSACANPANYSCLTSFEDREWHLGLAIKLLENTNRPLNFNASTSFRSYVAQFVKDNTRWETVGIFMCAVLRATTDIPLFPTLYITEQDKRVFRGKLLRLIGCSLDIALSLDCLNDLQHILQYENCIIHSYMYGDQSYHLWRRLGDVISSTFALGYHENLDSKVDAPRFLTEIRKTAFARIYSADKNVSLFLGRPPRLSKRFVCFQLPDSRLPMDGESRSTLEPLALRQWDPNTIMNYRAETRWSALCAFVKEDIMELMFDPNRSNYRRDVSTIQSMADAQWNALPEHFRRSDNVKQHLESPFERDFVVSIRLNFLHINFLLRRLVLNQLLEPSAALIEVSIEMLKLVVEVIMLRDELSNSGTRLSWKIAHYGLPAAGILLLAMLHPQFVPHCLQSSRSRILQDLAVLAAEVERGTLVKAEDPDYALLAKATQTIHRFLNFVHSEQSISMAPRLPDQQQDVGTWGSQLGQDLLESDFSFWQEIADHPSLYSQFILPANEEMQE